MSANEEPSNEPSQKAECELPQPKDGETKGGKKKPLTPEEQMALYEDSLKEDDWGHQPC